VDSQPDLRQRLIAQRVIPVLRLASAELTERAMDYLSDAGFGIFEITLTTPGAVELIKRFKNLFVGAGTVLDLDSAQRCIDAGARFLVSPCIVKVFPASSGGPAHLRAIRAIFPAIALCPTGGVSLKNLDDYFAAGAAVVGVGNDILDAEALAAGDRARCVAHARKFLP
jgi:2-dehydro-3-deoxyphosphogluconate aldolase/(4S)-4-hydroxy-2-oxoglutarate aldolase